MIVNSRRIFFTNTQRGASLLEVVLAMAIVAMIAPFLYGQISNATSMIHDMVTVRKITDLRNPALNFVRMNQGAWPDDVQIRLTPEDLAQISEMPAAGFVDKYSVRGATVTDIYLAFDLDGDDLHINKIAREIGADAAVVGPDGVAYSATFAATAPDFKPGYLIYRITRETAGEDKSKYLHRAGAGDDGLNVMLRDLNMGTNNVYDVGTVFAKNAQIRNASATFLETENLQSDAVYFSSGANLDNANIHFGNVRVSGDVSGFRNIFADKLNGAAYTTTGSVIADRATISKTLNIGRDLVLKSDSSRTISAFTALSANSVMTPYVSAENITFYENFGLTVSGELMMSTTAPIKIGGWSFPSTTPPRFSSLTFSRAQLPRAPTKSEFNAIMKSGWRDAANVLGTIQ